MQAHCYPSSGCTLDKINEYTVLQPVRPESNGVRNTGPSQTAASKEASRAAAAESPSTSPPDSSASAHHAGSPSLSSSPPHCHAHTLAARRTLAAHRSLFGSLNGCCSRPGHSSSHPLIRTELTRHRLANYTGRWCGRVELPSHRRGHHGRCHHHRWLWCCRRHLHLELLARLHAWWYRDLHRLPLYADRDCLPTRRARRASHRLHECRNGSESTVRPARELARAP